MKKNTIHRSTNYIEFIAAHDTNATNAGCMYQAWRDGSGHWHLYDNVSGASYLCPIATLRVIISEITAQAHADLPLAWRLQH